LKIVRKEFKAVGNTVSDYEKELHNLSMLSTIKHRNIVEILVAYTFKGKHNLIFPKARQKTLSDLLEGPCPSKFERNEHVILALADLCSAVHAVHNFTSPDFNLSAIGCHHDLKPDNVLVDNDIFILADFGLSTFKDSTKSSNTQYKPVRGDYVAPECEEFRDLSQIKVINRSSDIWSLGCIMLEVLTYMMSGPEGVKTFETSRVFKEGDYVRHRFHRGFDQEEPAVIAQLEGLLNNLHGRSEKKVTRLVQEMLQIDPRKRPRAPEVDEKMRYIAIEAISWDVWQCYYLVLQKSQALQARIALQKFTSWSRACNLYEHEVIEQWGPVSYPDYESTRKYLLDTRGTLKAILPDCKHANMHIYQRLDALNEKLLAGLSTDLQRQARVSFKFNVLDFSETFQLDDKARDLSLPDSQAEFRVLAKVKLLNQLVGELPLAGSSKFRIDPSRIENETESTREATDGHLSANLKTEGDDRVRVIVERKRYAHGVSKAALIELVDRLSDIANLLSEAIDESGFRLLPCLGFYHDPAWDSCGLIYGYPPSRTPSSELRFTTLKDGLDLSYHKELPVLGSRFKLAKDLAVSLLKFHEARWLQKNISSFNIGFFHLEKDTWLSGMDKPYFLGFLNSRPNKMSVFTEFVVDENQQDYQHPAYIEGSGKVRYQPQFDYYSLGLVLLEIGRWKSLEKMSKNRGRSDDLLMSLTSKEVPTLEQSMGSIYRDVVESCLSGKFERSEQTEHMGINDSKLHLSFSKLVVNQLARCTV
jgi:hypothetical protein